MRIGIDARELCGQATGVGRYLAGLLHEWSIGEHGRRHEFVLYTHQPLTTALDTRRFPTRVVNGSGGSVWEQRKLPAVAARDHLDVFFAPGYTAPLLLVAPTVVAIHDVSFAAHPEWFSMREGLRRRTLCRHAARRARTVITISEFSKAEIVERLRVPADRIRVVPPGVHGDHPSASATRNGSNVLYVGSIFNRRHVPDLIDAFAHLARRAPEAELDLVGDNRSYPYEDLAARIEHTRLGPRIRWHRYASEERLAALYRSAKAFAFLSEYEGLGLTPLEALAAGVPSVLLDTPVARESCGDAALYVSNSRIGDVEEALRRLLFDEPTRRLLLAAAPAVLDRYRWPRAAAETLAVLEDAAA